MLDIRNLTERLLDEFISDKDLNESKLLTILAEELKGTLDIINANLWKINSFKGSEIKKIGNVERYATLLGCYGYIPNRNNANEFIHDLSAGIFGTILDGMIYPDSYFEISLSKDLKYKKLLLAPERVEKYNLDRLIVIPMTFKNIDETYSEYVLKLYAKPYESITIKGDFENLINSIKKIFLFNLQNNKKNISAKLIKMTMDHFERFTWKNKDTPSNLHLLIDKLRNFIEFDACSIFMWDPIYQQLVLKKSSAKEFHPKSYDTKWDHRKPFYNSGEGKTGKVFQTGEPLIIHDINNFPEKDKYLFRENITHAFRSFMAIPIIHPSRPFEKLGVIRLVNRLNHYNQNIVDYFSYDDYRLIKDFASFLALHLEVEQSVKIRTAFTKHLEHEIVGPIISTRNDADRILDKRMSGGLPEWQLTGNLHRIVDNANLLMSIIKNVRYTWKGSEGISLAELYNVDESVNFLDDILKPARNLVIPLLRNEGFTPDSIHIEGGDFKLCIDKEAFRQVFVNLFSNSIKYRNRENHSKTLVNVECVYVDKNHPIDIQVIDYGRGIAKENLDRVFQFGFREKDSLATNIRGLGIGLSVVKKIIDDFHSKISIKPPLNTPRTKPTTFKISLSAKLNDISYTNEEKWKKASWGKYD